MTATRFLSFVAVLTAFLVCGAARAQIFNCYEGQGILENAWSDWSWCPDNIQSTSYLYNSHPYSTQVTFTAAYQGFRLETEASFSAGYFSALSFVINGGTTAGRSISVGLDVNGVNSNSVNLNDYIQGGSVGANTWRVVSIPLSAFGLHPTDQISEFWLQDASGNAQPPFWIDQICWTPATPPNSVTVTINPATILRAVDQKMFGINTAIWDANFTSTACTNLLNQAGYKAFRFPGGSDSDSYNWSTNMSGSNTWQWTNSFDDFASVAVPATGGQCFITTNYGSGTAAEAAAWVQYSNVTKGYGMKYWEVGNEVMGDWELDLHALPHDPITYATQFALYYQAMKAVDPTIEVGAVAVPGEDAYANYPTELVTNPVTGLQHSGWTPVMLATMRSLGVTPDFLIYHRYPEYGNDCDFALLTSNTGWYTDMASLRTQLVDYLGSANTQTQIMCTENGNDSVTEGKQQCSLVNGLFMADTFGTILQTECNSYMWWDLVNGQTTAGDNGSWLYGWREYGDEGVFSTDFTQTYPVYYMEQLFNLFAQPGDSVVSATSSYGLLSAYATTRSDGSLRLMFVNKNPTATLSAALSLAGYVAPSFATEYSYGMAQDNAAMNGQPQAISSSLLFNTSSSMTLTFPPYSVTVLVFTKPLVVSNPVTLPAKPAIKQ